MHCWYYTDNWAFHTNSDPFPGPVLINQYDDRGQDDALFRATTEEIVTFVMASMIDAAPHYMTLKTVVFCRVGDSVTLTVGEKTPVITGDATMLVVPFDHLKAFVADIMQRKLEISLADRAIDTRLATLGIAMAVAGIALSGIAL